MRIRPPRSLIARILLAEIAIILLAALLLWQVTAELLDRTVDRFQERGLSEQAFAVLHAASIDRRGRWFVQLPVQLQPIYSTGYDGRGYMLLDPAGRQLTSSRFSQPQIALSAPRPGHQSLFHRGEITGLSLPAVIAGRQVWIVVTLNEQGPGAIIDDVVRAFLLDYVGILFGLLLLLLTVNGLVLTRMVRAVTLVSTAAKGIGTRALDRRLDESGVPLEIAPLVRATNDLVDRLEASFRLHTEFSANLAHELRTPLATLKAQLDGIEDPQLKIRTGLQIDRIAHILSQLRDLAALEDMGPNQTDSIDLAAIAIEVIARIAPRAMMDGHNLAFVGDAKVIVQGNAMLVDLALTNLVDNAIKHTPGGTLITVEARQATVSVSDNGPGVSVAQADLLTRRYWRADWERTDSAGLGLSIVQRIMDVHGGKLDLELLPVGALFRLDFPPPVTGRP
ncbi:sensor histidine kinase [Sphingomonas abietis]|uniref:histidine kinase n=1 Tax=Sphingomonas abietis TaxID=3012344 RepID=A0ABY7NIS7_9SPHN|nr:HAMP domain-containing sensor histidine kinase [Sphingomonas abietis]WBO21398.1 HAMP domain-containing sensor histidine kinase [Sphingomonas abietis]